MFLMEELIICGELNSKTGDVIHEDLSGAMGI